MVYKTALSLLSIDNGTEKLATLFLLHDHISFCGLHFTRINKLTTGNPIEGYSMTDLLLLEVGIFLPIIHDGQGLSSDS